MRRIAPSKGEAGIVGLAAAIPFLMGAVPEAQSDLQGILYPAILTAVSALAGVVGKGAVVLVYSTLRRWAQAKKNDKNPDNDVIADAVLDTVDRLDPEGKKGDE
jgi:membrane-bound ClpP family serine protease